jgi:hypothetical protein
MKTKKEWKAPEIQEVKVQEDSTTMACEGKRVGCYAGSSCGSIEIQPEVSEEPKK